MRELIKQILKEETSSDEIKKGIDIAVKILKKNYPFIVGWKYSDSPDKWKYSVYIDLEIDYQKTLEYYGLEPHPKFHNLIKMYIENREKIPFPFSLTNYEYLDNFDDMEEYSRLQEDIKETYQDMIPRRLQMNRGEGAVLNQNSPKELKIDNFIYVE